MAIIKETVKVFFAGNSIELIKGNEVQDSSPLVKAKPELFEIKEVTKPKAVKKAAVKKVEKKVEVKEEPKEELLVEAPVAELEVTEVTEEVEAPAEEVVEEAKPKRRKRK